MCDTLYLSRGGKSFFGKNSDRSPNEAHIMVRCPARDYAAGTTLKTTYVTLPQATHTYACVLLKPHWIWGAEMGWNECGLHIGNEALFTNVKREKKDGLIGMDLLRLALERTSTAIAAAELIVSLVSEYGQDGNCAFDKKFFYHNAFLIADGKDAFVLETAGRHWALRRADDVLLLDEPTASMDINSTALTEEVLRKYCERVRPVVVMATHSMQQARRLADYVIFLDNGKAEEIAPPEKLFACPSSDKTRDFLNFNFLGEQF